MTSEIRSLSRRKLLQQSLLSGGWWFSSLRRRTSLGLLGSQISHARPHESFLGVVPFSGEGNPPMAEAIGSELDGRLFTDLSAVTPDNRVTPTDRFFIRTRASKLLDTRRWDIQIGGLVNKPLTIPGEALTQKARPMGAHLMECSGNTRSAHFGMISVADWDGIPLQEILEKARPQASGAHVLVSGFDQYQEASLTSVPGASWIFSQEQIFSSHAFLATAMNGQALSPDHGAPVRLVVPGWYGCVSIKWVNQIDFISRDAAATSQMREYAGRTLQSGVPSLARDYQPATVGAAAMPTRIEKWRLGEKFRYHVAGIRWGTASSAGCEIRFSADEEFVPVETFEPVGDTWSFWSCDWTPHRRGQFSIRLRSTGEKRDTRKLDSGYYDRFVEIVDI